MTSISIVTGPVIGRTDDDVTLSLMSSMPLLIWELLFFCFVHRMVCCSLTMLLLDLKLFKGSSLTIEKVKEFLEWLIKSSMFVSYVSCCALLHNSCPVSDAALLAIALTVQTTSCFCDLAFCFPAGCTWLIFCLNTHPQYLGQLSSSGHLSRASWKG